MKNKQIYCITGKSGISNLCSFTKKKGLTSGKDCGIIATFRNRWCGSMAEQLICNQQVVGSTPTVGFLDL